MTKRVVVGWEVVMVVNNLGKFWDEDQVMKCVVFGWEAFDEVKVVYNLGKFWDEDQVMKCVVFGWEVVDEAKVVYNLGKFLDEDQVMKCVVVGWEVVTGVCFDFYFCCGGVKMSRMKFGWDEDLCSRIGLYLSLVMESLKYKN